MRPGGWFGGWGWGATPFGTHFRVTAPSEDSEADASSAMTPTSNGTKSPAVSIASISSKSAPAPVVLAADGVAISTGASPALSASSAQGEHESGVYRVDNKPVPIAVYRSMVVEQQLRESMMESMQM